MNEVATHEKNHRLPMPRGVFHDSLGNGDTFPNRRYSNWVKESGAKSPLGNEVYSSEGIKAGSGKVYAWQRSDRTWEFSAKLPGDPQSTLAGDRISLTWTKQDSRLGGLKSPGGQKVAGKEEQHPKEAMVDASAKPVEQKAYGKTTTYVYKNADSVPTYSDRSPSFPPRTAIASIKVPTKVETLVLK